MIATKIRQMCKERHITIAELERVTGIGNGVIARWDNFNPRVDRIKLVADYFGVTVDELLDDEQAKADEIVMGSE